MELRVQELEKIKRLKMGPAGSKKRGLGTDCSRSGQAVRNCFPNQGSLDATHESKLSPTHSQHAPKHVHEATNLRLLSYDSGLMEHLKQIRVREKEPEQRCLMRRGTHFAFGLSIIKGLDLSVDDG